MTEITEFEKFLEVIDHGIDRQCGDHPRTGDAPTILAILYVARAVLMVGQKLDDLAEIAEAATGLQRIEQP